MATNAQVRQIRLANDHTEMRNIVTDWLSWKGTRGASPQFEAYEVKLRIRTIVGPEPTYHNDHVLSIDLPANYPDGLPKARMVSKPYPFHPNWFVDGRWCPGSMTTAEGLGEFVIRLIQTLQYNTDITNEHSPANAAANDWYMERRKLGLFPCDRTPLPDPSTARPKFTLVAPRRFIVKS